MNTNNLKAHQLMLGQLLKMQEAFFEAAIIFAETFGEEIRDTNLEGYITLLFEEAKNTHALQCLKTELELRIKALENRQSQTARLLDDIHRQQEVKLIDSANPCTQPNFLKSSELCQFQSSLN